MDKNSTGISPVLGTIIIIGITIALSVTVFLALPGMQDSTAPPQAGTNVEQDSSSGTITITPVTIQNADEIRVYHNGTLIDTTSQVGAKIQIGNSTEVCEGDTITIKGVRNGEESVIESHDVKNTFDCSTETYTVDNPNEAPTTTELQSAFNSMETNEDGAYVITNIHQLQAMNEDLTADYVLGSDIDASGTQN